MIQIDRTDPSVIGRWWWTIDKWQLGLLIILSIFGGFLVAAASPAVAERIGLSSFYFVNRHLVYMAVTFSAMLLISLFGTRTIRRMAILGFIAAWILMVLTLFIGVEIKGAQRWIHLGFFSLQPSEFLKPLFIVVSAWLIARQQTGMGKNNYYLCGLLYFLCLTVLIAQPDFGMTMLITLALGAQIFLAGLPLAYIVFLLAGLVVAIIGGYMFLPHVTSRINRFIDPSSGDTYQIERSMQSFANGGFFGVGPGEGTVKLYLPDAHADFIYSVSGEELGLLWTLALTFLFLAIVLRGFLRAYKQEDLFTLLAVGGLLSLFGMQAMIHMASSLHMIPTKGMTLPFISYGGSSLVAMGMGMGIVLALTRKIPNFKGVKDYRPVLWNKTGLNIPITGKVR